MHGVRVRRLRCQFDLDAKLPLRGVRVEVSWGCAATGADVWEESEGADVCERIGEGEDVVADRHCGIFLLSMMLMAVELVDVKDDLVWSLRQN